MGLFGSLIQGAFTVGGALAGSAVPGIGTAAGAAAGSTLGGGLGGALDPEEVPQGFQPSQFRQRQSVDYFSGAPSRSMFMPARLAPELDNPLFRAFLS